MSTTRLYRGYVKLGLTDIHTSTPGSMGKIRFHLVGRIEKRVNS
jgi:hypothetical protein